MKRLLNVAAALFCAVGLTALAATSNATATISDLDGQTWGNGTFIATLVTANAAPTISGVPVTSLRVSGTLSASGGLTATLTDTSSIDQNGATWSFHLCSNTSAPCVDVTGVTVVGAAPSLSTALTAGLNGPRFNAGPNAYGYRDAEVLGPVVGQTYYNVTTPCLRQHSLAGWTCGGGGGGGGAVSSVFNRTGDVAAQTGDYSASQITNAADLSKATEQDFSGALKFPAFLLGARVASTLSGDGQSIVVQADNGVIPIVPGHLLGWITDTAGGGHGAGDSGLDASTVCSSTNGRCAGGGGLADPGANGIVFRTALNTTAPATAAQVQTVLASDTVNNTSLGFSTGSGGDTTCPTAASGKDYLCMRSGHVNYSHNAGAYAPTNLEFVDATSSIQTQLNAKAPAASPAFTGTATAVNLTVTGTCTGCGGSGGGGNIMVVPRDINFHIAVIAPGSSRFDGLGSSWFNGIGGGTITYNSTPDAAGYTSASIPSGTTANTVQGWSSAKDLLAINPSFKIIAGLSSATANAWVGLTDQFSGMTAALDPGMSLGANVEAFRHFTGTDTNWTCYASSSSVAGTTADSGVAVNTTRQQAFDVISTAGVPKFYIDGVQVCASMSLPHLPGATNAVGTIFAWQNTTATSVTGSNHEDYYGAN